MSRGFDGFEIDDFRESSWDKSRDVDRTSSSLWGAWQKIQDIRREEERADRSDRERREHSGRERPALAREERVQAILSQRIRTKYTDRNKDYSLRDSEIHTLGEVGKFRVVAVQDLAEYAYKGDRARAENDVENLENQGLVKQTTIADPEHNPTSVVTLTKEGHKLLSRGKVVDSGQAIYHGLKKPKEAFHDVDLYRLYNKVSDEIESRGGKVLRVQLDYEMKRERRRSSRRVGNANAPSGRRASLQEVFADEVADEARSSRKDKSSSQRNAGAGTPGLCTTMLQ